MTKMNKQYIRKTWVAYLTSFCPISIKKSYGHTTWDPDSTKTSLFMFGYISHI